MGSYPVDSMRISIDGHLPSGHSAAEPRLVSYYIADRPT